jgi:hypothetical protein
MGWSQPVRGDGGIPGTDPEIILLVVEMFKTESDIAGEIIQVICNVESFEDAREFIRIYILSMQKARESIRDDVPGLNRFDENKILRLIGEIDKRFE